MEIPGYSSIRYDVCLRAWGPECQYTAIRADNGKHINDTVSIKDVKLDEDSLREIIIERLSWVDRPDESPEKSITYYTEDDVERILRDKGYLKDNEKLKDLKDAEDFKKEKDGK